MDREQTKEALQHELESLHLALGEVLVEAGVDHMDVHREWDRLDDALRFARAEINRLGDDSGTAAGEIEEASRQILADVRAGCERMRERAARAKLRDQGCGASSGR